MVQAAIVAVSTRDCLKGITRTPILVGRVGGLGICTVLVALAGGFRLRLCFLHIIRGFTTPRHCLARIILDLPVPAHTVRV